jgi:hypothetical protein
MTTGKPSLTQLFISSAVWRTGNNSQPETDQEHAAVAAQRERRQTKMFPLPTAVRQ